MNAHSIARTTPPGNMMTDFLDRFRQTCVPHAPAPASQDEGSKAPTPPTPPVGVLDAEPYFEATFLPVYARAQRAAKGLLDVPFAQLPIDQQRQYRVDARRALALGQVRAYAWAKTAIGVVLAAELKRLFARSPVEVDAIVLRDEDRNHYCQRLAELLGAAFTQALTDPVVAPNSEAQA